MHTIPIIVPSRMSVWYLDHQSSMHEVLKTLFVLLYGTPCETPLFCFLRAFLLLAFVFSFVHTRLLARLLRSRLTLQIDLKVTRNLHCRYKS